MIKNSKKEDVKKVILNMIQELPERSRSTIEKRFNLDGRGTKTLDSIGKEYNITRERVRQIEKEALIKLKKIGKNHNIANIFQFIEKAIDKHGGIMSEDKIVTHLFEGKNEEINKQISLLILSLDDRIKKEKETKRYKKLYFYERGNVEKLKDMIDTLEKHLHDNKKDIDFDNIVILVSGVDKNEKDNNFSKEHIKSYLEANKVVLKNIIGNWGHEKWSHINPKSIRDKSYLALKKNKKPLHFTEIADSINEIWKNKRKANNQTVHNELIKDKRFVLVGRGIYALKEWGYRPGTVLDVIIEVFKESGREEISQDNIITEVLKKRKVKNNTIILNLQNKNYFVKLPDKIYRLKNK
ncbi:MAG: hypothetical protein KAS01_02120 [Candidatus Pacebacteria bacterium]|nr:hypothetical protein [Candidatus Paceibacterota bacterium]